MVHIRSKKVIGFTIFLLLFVPMFFSITILNESDSSKYYFTDSLYSSDGYSDVNLSVIPEINYTLLNSSWYDQQVEMLIITQDNDAFYNACIPLMEWKNEKGLKTVILRNYTSYSGVDNPEKIRNMIKYFYENASVKWVLLAGDTDILPIREVYNPDITRYGKSGETEEMTAAYYQSFKPTDFYYADLTGDWNEDGDSNWGEAAKDNTNGIDEIDWIPEVYVGRLPASSSTELETMINKTLNYEKNPSIGDWMNRMLLAGGVSDTVADEPPDGEDECKLTTFLIQNYVQNEMNFKHLYRSTYYDPPDPKELLSSTSYNTEFNSGYTTVFFAGHGSHSSFTSRIGGTIYTSTNANNANNNGKLSLVYGDACTTAPYDYDPFDSNIGENLIKNPNAGAIGYIGALRITWYILDDNNLKYVNRGCAKMFWKEFFENEKFQQGRALYDSKVSYMDSTFEYISMEYDYQRKNVLTYNLLGDPEVDIYTDIPESVANPFTGNIYEGQLISIPLNPYTKVHLRNDHGAYRTVYADENGIAKFRLPLGDGINYNVTITGHNYIPSYFNFTTLADEVKPFPSINYAPKIPTTFNNVQYNVYTNESKSGIECIYSFMTKDNYESYSIHCISNNFQENESILEIELNKLEPGNYDYSFYIFARDYANNTQTYLTSISFSIAVPLTDYFLITASILMIGFSGISVYLVYSGIQKYSLIYKRMEDI